MERLHGISAGEGPTQERRSDSFLSAESGDGARVVASGVRGVGSVSSVVGVTGVGGLLREVVVLLVVVLLGLITFGCGPPS